MPEYHAVSGSAAEDLFIELFSDAFGAEKAGYLYSQYHFYPLCRIDCFVIIRFAAGLAMDGPAASTGRKDERN